MRALSFEFSPAFIDKTILEETLRKEPARATAWKLKYEQTVCVILILYLCEAHTHNSIRGFVYYRSCSETDYPCKIL